MAQLIFILLLAAGTYWFTRNVIRIRRLILLGRKENRSDNPGKRWATMARVALGQSKMVVRPVSGILHIFVYAGFVIINIEVLEIIIDGVAGTHRVFAPIGPLYNVLIGSFEILAFLVLFGCVLFLIRRNVLRLKRFWMREMTAWPRTDANLILITEILLMAAFLTMNAADYVLQNNGAEHYIKAGSFPVSGMYAQLFAGMSNETLIMVERICWWFHIIGILAFLNYLPYSKHFHILLAFPNTYYSNLNPKGQFTNLESVTNEVKLMFAPPPPEGGSDPSTADSIEPLPPSGGGGAFGAKDVYDLSWKNLMDAFSCTECGRCTSECPANQTGKLLSPRKIMMDTRDRLEEIGKGIDKHGKDYRDEKSLFDYIKEEELWACTTCNACVQACPVNIDPLNIIVEMRRYLVMEKSQMPGEIQMMLTKVENNGAPWQFSQADRANWTNNV